MTTQTPDAVREAYMQGQIDMRERAAQVCDQRGAEEQEGFGLVRGTQNYFRARNAVRDLEIAALDSRAGDAGEDHNGGRCPDCDGTGDVHRIDGEWLGTCHCPAGTFSNPSTFGKPTFGVAATPAPAVDAVELAAFGASEHACALYPGADQAAERAAFIAGAAHEAKPAVDAVPADVFPETIGRVHLGERRSDGERLCSHGHPVPAGHPLYWPQQISQYDDSDPLCLTHAIDQLADDNADWGEDYESVDAVPAGEAETTLNRDDLYRFMDTLKLSEKREVAKAIGFDPAPLPEENDMDRWKRMWAWAAENGKKPELATAIRAALSTRAGQ